MSSEQSEAAIFYAFCDARNDILYLYEKVEKMREMLRIASYPKRGTIEEGMDQFEIAKMIMSNFTREELVDGEV